MKRALSDHLQEWISSPTRKPLILRGARQVGKTWLVRDFAKRNQLKLIEVNFERNPEYKQYFSSNDPKIIIGELSLLFNCEIKSENCLIFLDEIQEAGEILAKLRWFSEEMPQLPLVAAGSLLEFTLADHTFSMPVGRVSFKNVEPMGFEEFLLAHGQNKILDEIISWRFGKVFSEAAHQQAQTWFHRYSMVGGMPAIVSADCQGQSPIQCRELQLDLMTAYRSDFAKYSGRMQPNILDSVLRSVAGSIGHKFIYAQAGNGVKQQQAKRALELLVTARLCHLVQYSFGKALPLAAESKDTFRKVVLLDIGLLHALLGTPAMGNFPSPENLSLELRGRMAEQIAAQHLRLVNMEKNTELDLFYWQREGGRPGEVDYLWSHGEKIIPIELKSRSAGSMKSLHQFMFDKKLKLALRCDSNPPSEMEIKMTTTQGNPVEYRLLSIPNYLLWNLNAILKGAMGN